MNYCPGCGNKLKNAFKCDNCGLVIGNVAMIPVVANQSTNNYVEDGYDTCSMLGFWFSIVNIFLCGVLSFPALIISIVGCCTAGSNNKKGLDYAISGIIISIFTIIAFFFIVAISYS